MTDDAGKPGENGHQKLRLAIAENRQLWDIDEPKRSEIVAAWAVLALEHRSTAGSS